MIKGELAERFNSDFEAGMKSVDPRMVSVLQRAMAAYFFEFKPQQSNLYFKLAQKIHVHSGWSGAICTLNYERLLEICLIAAGIQPFSGIKPPTGKSLEICFPHGCCHIFCDAAQGASGSVQFDAFAVQSNGPVKTIVDPVKHRQRVIDDAFPPVMSYFEPSKHTTSGSSFINEQRSRWRHLCSDAETIITVGVRARPHDDHIWAPVANSKAKVIYCGGMEGGAEYASWASSARPHFSDHVCSGFFQDEFNLICYEAGL